jgi:hypothetical protein
MENMGPKKFLYFDLRSRVGGNGKFSSGTGNGNRETGNKIGNGNSRNREFFSREFPISGNFYNF